MTGIACASNLDEEALKELLDVFGSKFSLEDIASAYYEAKGNVNITGDILYARNNGSSSRSTAHTFNNKSIGASTSSIKMLSGMESEITASSGYTYPNTGVIGENYVKPRPSRMDSPDTSKPVKIDSKEFLASLIWSEEDPSSMTIRNGTTHGDLEKFLFEMLGDGFQLQMPVIQEVLDCCGFDVDKSMDKLLDVSASTLKKSDDVIGIAAEKITGKCLQDQSVLLQDKLESKESSQSEEVASMMRKPKRIPRRNKDKVALEKDILQALFTAPERTEEASVRAVTRSKALGELVTEPLKDTDTSFRPVVEMQKLSKDVEDERNDDENSYDTLRQAVKEYWMSMKGYYKAAAEAYAKGDKARATKLVGRGHFFHEKAREADERSSAKMLESSCSDEEMMSLDLGDFEPKEAVQLLRVLLTSVSGIPTIKYLRIIVGTIEEDTKKGARRRRRLIMKLLEKESIKWKEEENGRRISIQVDVIDPKLLSFAKKN